jgi:hypothetical protein
MIFVVAEHKDNKLKPITSELLVFGQRGNVWDETSANL